MSHVTKKRKQEQKEKQNQEQQFKQGLIRQILDTGIAQEQDRMVLSTKSLAELQQITRRIQQNLENEALHLAYVKLRSVQGGPLNSQQQKLRILNAAASAVTDLGLVEVPTIHANFALVENDIKKYGLDFTVENVVTVMLYGHLNLIRDGYYGPRVHPLVPVESSPGW